MLVDREDPDRVVLHVAGELDLAGLPRFRRLLDRLLADRPATVEIDLSRVELIETVSAAALARAQAAAQRRGTAVSLAGASGTVALLLRMATARLAGERRT